MAAYTEGTAQNGSASAQTGTARVKRGMAEMLKGGVIMDVVTPEQARIAEGAQAGHRKRPFASRPRIVVARAAAVGLTHGSAVP